MEARALANDLTIEQLAAESGLTVRNIRSHRTLGLLPPPEVRDGVGYYGAEHLARLRLIQELQTEGVNLRGVKLLLEEIQGPAAGLLGLKRALTTPAELEGAEVVTVRELVDRLGEQAKPELLDKALELGVLVPLGDDRYEVPSPTLLHAAEDIVRSGVPLDDAFPVFELVRAQCEEISRAFVRVFFTHVWTPFQEANYPASRWDEVIETIDRLRPLAARAVLATFQQTLAGEIEGAFGKEIERLSGGRGG